MGQTMDTLFALRLLRLLVQPFRSSDAYRLGVININGERILDPSKFTYAQKNAYTPLIRIAFKLKRLINRIPGGESQIKSLIAAYYLVRESYENNLTDISEEQFFRVQNLLNEGVIFVEEQLDVERFLAEEEHWQKVNRKDKTDGMSAKAVKAYRREHPGSKLQTAVTENKPSGKRAKRRKAFCSRMKGMKNKKTSAKNARDPDSPINKALRRWKCR